MGSCGDGVSFVSADPVFRTETQTGTLASAGNESSDGNCSVFCAPASDSGKSGSGERGVFCRNHADGDGGAGGDRISQRTDRICTDGVHDYECVCIPVAASPSSDGDGELYGELHRPGGNNAAAGDRASVSCGADSAEDLAGDPGSAEEAGNTTSFWNTSNPGTSQGMGAIGGAVNPTTGVQSPVHTTGEGAYAAKLQTTNKLSVLAAASLYTGSFLGLSGMSANMEFGKPFTSRPVALHGYYMYTPQVINRVSRVPEGVEIVQNETMDQCAIFIALAKKSFTFNNNKEEEYIDYEGDDNIIAYGELPSGAATSGDVYTEFTIPLKYKESQFGEQPTHIIIVCSASKYGDYMTGGDNSLLYVDDFSLVYDGTPTIWENK